MREKICNKLEVGLKMIIVIVICYLINCNIFPISGEGKFSLLGKDQKIKPSSAAKSSSQCKSLTEMPSSTDMHLETGESLSSVKMKIQLFPVNEPTRLRLEKVGLLY